MKFPLRFLAAGLAVLLPTAVMADEPYPQKPITVVVPQSPGSVADIMARAVSGPLSKALGQPVVVDNRNGASGIIGAERVARAKPDGYTLFVGSVSTHGLNSGIYKTLSYDPLKDFAPITQIADSPLVIVTSPESQIRTLNELIARAKANPGKLTFASAGNGSGSRFTGELLKASAGIDLTHIPYRGPAEAVAAVVGGEATIAIPSAPSTPTFIKSGRLVPLAVTGTTRSDLLPDVPTTTELGHPSIVFTSWTGLFAPAGTPQSVIDLLYTTTKQVLAQPEVKKVLADAGATPVGSTPAEFRVFVEEQVAKWTKAAKDANIAEN
ncbi:Bug family tripartite tricarboxylate transporter substrate binding protein [Aquabacter cavernae]|uniref:Bug family tripartite tricarboxylate transporter substrate binding protein n=1 Tax=Aquabacter cavernae TaxID=2496029 RepID=UPI000F8E9FA1|nr:tripartite tricarboxylate transporter substrate binding protein [Aquabacter cavernae]